MIIKKVLTYQGIPLDAFDVDGQLWLPASGLAACLAMKAARSVNMVYQRHADEFMAEETCMLTLPTPGGPQTLRVFSPRGLRLLAFFVRTPPAQRFRAWVLDLLDGKLKIENAVEPLAVDAPQRALPASISPSRARHLDLPTETLQELGTFYALFLEKMAENRRQMDALREEAASRGYTMAEIRAHAAYRKRQAKLLGQGPHAASDA